MATAATLQLENVASPIGDLLVATLGDAVCAIAFEGSAAETEQHLDRRYGECAKMRGPVPVRVRDALQRYFDGDMAAFDGIAVTVRGTPFQQQVWAALRTIPAGETRSYADMAEQIGRPSATRAVGLANGQNPVPIMVPCHRVIGRDGSLTGFGGGLERKAWLLRHEGALATLDLQRVTHIVNGLLVREGLVLLVRRSARRKRYPDTWSFPGGHVEEGETLDAALVREIDEELAIVPTAYEPLGTLADPHAPDAAPVTYHLYAITGWHGGEPTLQGDEHSALHWFSPDDAMLLPDLALPSYRPLLSKLRNEHR